MSFIDPFFANVLSPGSWHEKKIHCIYFVNPCYRSSCSIWYILLNPTFSFFTFTVICYSQMCHNTEKLYAVTCFGMPLSTFILSNFKWLKKACFHSAVQLWEFWTIMFECYSMANFTQQTGPWTHLWNLICFMQEYALNITGICMHIICMLKLLFIPQVDPTSRNHNCSDFKSDSSLVPVQLLMFINNRSPYKLGKQMSASCRFLTACLNSM